MNDNRWSSWDDSKILCIVGADHNYYFKEELEKEPIKLVYPLKNPQKNI